MKTTMRVAERHESFRERVVDDPENSGGTTVERYPVLLLLGNDGDGNSVTLTVSGKEFADRALDDVLHVTVT